MNDLPWGREKSSETVWHDVKLCELRGVSLHEKQYFPGPAIIWKTQKGQVNITFTSTFLLKKKDCISHYQKVQNKNFFDGRKQELFSNQLISSFY